jgi:hypothetical protein
MFPIGSIEHSGQNWLLKAEDLAFLHRLFTMARLTGSTLAIRLRRRLMSRVPSRRFEQQLT